jgi:hypothetical protein
LLSSLLSSPLTADVSSRTVVSLLSQVVAALPPSPAFPAPDAPNFLALLQKEAVLLAVGVDAQAVQPALEAAHFDFAAFYSQILCAEMAAACALPADAQGSPAAAAGRHVLLRRVVLLLGQWADLVPSGMRVALLRDAIVPALADQVPVPRQGHRLTGCSPCMHSVP